MGGGGGGAIGALISVPDALKIGALSCYVEIGLRCRVASGFRVLGIQSLGF